MMSPVGALLGLLIVIPSHGQSTEYGRWAAFQAGATASYRHSGEVAGKAIQAERAYALIEVSPERAILEEKITSSTGPASCSKLELRAWSSREREVLREGEEDLEVGGRTLRCRWSETREGPDLRMKEWLSAEVPGGLVRREVESLGASKAKTVLALVSWKGERKARD